MPEWLEFPAPKWIVINVVARELKTNTKKDQNFQTEEESDRERKRKDYPTKEIMMREIWREGLRRRRRRGGGEASDKVGEESEEMKEVEGLCNHHIQPWKWMILLLLLLLTLHFLLLLLLAGF